MADVTVYVVRAVSMFAPGSQSARLAGSESKMVRVITEADHDRIVAEAEARGWNAAVEAADPVVAAMPTAFWINSSSDEAQDHKRYVRAAIAALRKPEVEG